MPHEHPTAPAAPSDASAPPLRRDVRAARLPAAPPVARALGAPRVHRVRLIAGFAAVAAIGALSLTAGMLAMTHPAFLTGPADDATASVAGEGGAHGDLRVPDRHAPGGIVPIDEQTDAGDAADPAGSEPPASDAGAHDASDSASDAAGSSAPGADDAGSSSGSAPASSRGPAPAPSSPAPAPSAPAPPSPAPKTPEDPAPLAFTGLTENSTVNLLGIRLVSSCTLSLSGEPGATASVTYGGRAAGEVTFDRDGRASLRIDGGLLELQNPLVGAEYSDGTAGAPIEARRDAI